MRLRNSLYIFWAKARRFLTSSRNGGAAIAWERLLKTADLSANKKNRRKSYRNPYSEIKTLLFRVLILIAPIIKSVAADDEVTDSVFFPVILTNAGLRSRLSSLLRNNRRRIHVLAYSEIPRTVTVETLYTIKPLKQKEPIYDR